MLSNSFPLRIAEKTNYRYTGPAAANLIDAMCLGHRSILHSAKCFFKKMCVRHAIRKNVRHLINGPLNALEATTIRLDLVIISNVIIADTRNLLGEEVRK